MKRMKVSMMNMTVMPLTLREMMTQVIVILAFITSDEEDANERPNRSVTRMRHVEKIKTAWHICYQAC